MTYEHCPETMTEGNNNISEISLRSKRPEVILLRVDLLHEFRRNALAGNSEREDIQLKSVAVFDDLQIWIVTAVH